MGYRLSARFVGVRGKLPFAWLGGLTVIAAALTALGEAVYFRLAYGVDPMRVFDANLSLDTGLRPAIIVLALGLFVTAVGAVWTWAPLIAKWRPRFACPTDGLPQRAVARVDESVRRTAAAI